MGYARGRVCGCRGATVQRKVRGMSMLAGSVPALLLAWSIPALIGAQQSTTAATPLVFDEVTVVDVERGELLQTQRVVVVGNRIQAVGGTGAVKIPTGAQVIDARDKYLIPGLWDLHVHLQGFRSSDSLPPPFFYKLLLANGVTGIRDAGSDVPLDTLRQWRREILAGTRVGPPRQIFSGPYIHDVACHVPFCVLIATSSKSSDDTSGKAERRLIDSLKTAGADMIKLRDLDRGEYFVMAAEARRAGIPFGGHATSVTAIEASDSGALIVDHVDRQYYSNAEGIEVLCIDVTASASSEQCQPVAERLRRNGTWWVPTQLEQVTWGKEGARRTAARLASHARKFWAGSQLLGNWLSDSAGSVTDSADSATNVSGAMAIIQRVDFPILAGTDVSIFNAKRFPAGFALHAELASYVREGLTPVNALQSATLNPAKMLRGTDSLGTVAPGKLADLVLLDANPLADITNTTMIRAVVSNGRYFDRAALDELLADVRR